MRAPRRSATFGLPTEEQEQIVVARWLDANGVLWCHPPNGGSRGKAEAGRFKVQGVKSGVPDILIFDVPTVCDDAKLRGSPDGHPRHTMIVTPADHRCALTARGVAIEMKRSKGGVLSPEQAKWRDDLISRGWIARVCAGASEAIEDLTTLGYNTRNIR